MWDSFLRSIFGIGTCQPVGMMLRQETTGNGKDLWGGASGMTRLYPFNKKDNEQMKALGLKPSDVHRQLSIHRQGSRFMKLVRPCNPGDGIRSYTAAQRWRFINLYDSEAHEHRILKFVPASGAASRMFASWFAAADQGSFGSVALDRSFFNDLEKMPFFPILRKDRRIHSMIKQRNVRDVLDYILLSTGLHFGWLPKALIPFHAYPDGEVRTALEEHLLEAASFIADGERRCRLHLTISAEHAPAVKSLLETVVPEYEKRCNVQFNIELSIQSPATNILAADENNLPFRDSDGRLVFRPGGHGALLQNLHALDADLIFIKNIDNIAPTTVQKKILPYKKMLGGLALELRHSVFMMVQQLTEGEPGGRELSDMVSFCRSEFGMTVPKRFSKWPSREKREWLRERLNRPLRVCGMVLNEGEPGGGPFWVREEDGSQTLQIIESFHVDRGLKRQTDIWSQSSYFNPVDLVCCTKNYWGEKFNLADFVNQDAYSISPKTERGRHLQAQELPGLWNGGMAYWNTIFVELPLTVFNPVKTINDLLRPEHLAGRKSPKR